MKVADLRITEAEISGWTEDKFETFTEIGALAQNSGFNGKAYFYEERGLNFVESAYQELSGEGDAAVACCVMDFSTAQVAEEAFTERTQEDAQDQLPQSSIGGYSESTALFYRSEYWAYAHFDRFLIWIEVQGSMDQDAAKTTAASFLEAYEAMIGS
ncbi:MAG: hypothetical protein GF410_10575 [Chitinivibrionales bacterium]|nr:hypothetical protein [Chitinivibrionales bacterium]